MRIMCAVGLGTDDMPIERPELCNIVGCKLRTQRPRGLILEKGIWEQHQSSLLLPASVVTGDICLIFPSAWSF
jgi:hypothetical protein